MNTDTSDITEAPPAGCKWKHNTGLEVGDEIFLGNHVLFGETQPFWGEITEISEKPKTFIVRYEATHARLYRQQATARLRKDEFTAVRIKDDA